MERNFPSYIDSFSLYNLMEPNGTGSGGSGLRSYYHHPPPPPQPQPQAPPSTLHSPIDTSASPPPMNGSQPNVAADRGSLPVFSDAGGAVISALEPVRKKRGRPRKYTAAAQEQVGIRTTTSLAPPSSTLPLPPPSSSSSSHKKKDKFFGGNAGQSFTPYTIEASAGEDVAQKIMMFMQQCKRELCILSASGSISNASLGQPATSGGNVTVEGRFEILSLCGSYVRTEMGGRTGGLSVCLSNTDGQIFGGVVGGPLKAAGPVQVIVGTFLIDTEKDAGDGVKGDASFSKLPLLLGGGASVSNVGFQSANESSGRLPIRASDDHRSVGGNLFTIQSQGMQMTHSQQPTGWRSGLDYGLTGDEAHGSPENGNYD